MFSSSIVNLHGTKTFGNIEKKVFYSSLVDVLQDKQPNIPVNKLGLVLKCLDALNTFRTGKLIMELAKISELFNKEYKRICLSLLGLAEKDGVLRAEFRINHNHIASIVPLLARKFASDEVLELAIPLKSSTVAKLSIFYTTMLSDPILTLLCHLSAIIEAGNLNEINGTLASLSAFETLLTYTLFSGRTNSYVRELIWSQGAENRQTSLQLMKSIFKYNHPVFPSNLFNTTSKQFTARPETLFSEMFKRFKTSIEVSIKTLEILIALRSHTVSDEKKAIILWKSYFSELPVDDFREPILDRWRCNSLKREEVVFGPVPLTKIEATAMVFRKGKEFFDSKAWERPYFKAFQLWCEEFPSLNHHDILSKACSISNFQIEIIRYHTTSTRFFSNGRRYMMVSSENLNIPKQADPNAARGEFILNKALEANGINYSEISSEAGIGKSRKRIRYTNEEIISLVRGINAFGEGKWTEILKCPDLLFNSSRTNVDSTIQGCNNKVFLALQSRFLALQSRPPVEIFSPPVETSSRDF